MAKGDERQMEAWKDRQGRVVIVKLAPNVECKQKRKSEWRDKWNWKAMDT